MRYQVIVAHQTDTGQERPENQDAVGYVYNQPSDCHLLVVADGMGGAACGARASRLAVQTICRTFFDSAGTVLSVNERLRRSLIAANHMIWRRAHSETACKGMGSTCVVLALLNDEVHAAHVGDSRIYLVNKERIQRLTRDHSHVQRLFEDGLITEEEAIQHPERSHIERALGPREIVKPEIRPQPLPMRYGDTFVLCSDGLTTVVRDEEIFSIALHTPAPQACEALVALANERGGPDNISVAIARIGDEVTKAF